MACVAVRSHCGSVAVWHAWLSEATGLFGGVALVAVRSHGGVWHAWLSEAAVECGGAVCVTVRSHGGVWRCGMRGCQKPPRSVAVWHARLSEATEEWRCGMRSCQMPRGSVAMWQA